MNVHLCVRQKFVWNTSNSSLVQYIGAPCTFCIEALFFVCIAVACTSEGSYAASYLTEVGTSEAQFKRAF